MKNTNNNVLWYNKPAEAWTDALPVGNGRLGAMVFGGIERERIQLNEETLWEGEPIDRNNPKALDALPKVQQLLFEDKNEEATKLAGETMLGVPPRIKSYQSLGDLILEFSYSDEDVSDYRRELDLETGVTKTTYRCGDAKFSREVFATAVDNLIVIKMECDTPEKLAFDITMTREQDASVEVVSDNTLKLSGKCSDGIVRFTAQLQIDAGDGKVESKDHHISVSNSNSVTLLLAGATSYVNQKDASGNPDELCENDITNVEVKSYSQIRSEHIAEHQSLFQRVDIDLGASDTDNLPTNERLAAVKEGASDPGLVALYFQYGRYLLMGSSRAKFFFTRKSTRYLERAHESTLE